MARYVGQRVIQLLIVLFVVTFLVAIALRFLPGGADVVVALKTGPGATPSRRRRSSTISTSIAASRAVRALAEGPGDPGLGHHVPDQPTHQGGAGARFPSRSAS